MGDNPTTLIITMAGLGERFRAVGQLRPKYQLEARGRSLFHWSMSSLRMWFESGARPVFVTRADDGAARFVEEQCAELGIVGAVTTELAELTDGQATTALAAGAAIGDADLPVAIFNIDTHVDPSQLDPRLVRGAGWVPCFPGEGSKWSFARVRNGDRIIEVREKEPISPHATVGFYWFSSFDLYRRAYRACYEEGGGPEQGERYVAPLYNQLIAWDHECYIQRLPRSAVVGLGTPADVEAFEQGVGRGWP